MPDKKRPLRIAAYVLLLCLLTLQPVFGADFYSSTAVAFVSPDNSHEAFSSFLREVDSFAYISAYTLDSALIAEDLSELLKDGKNVTIIVEAMPVGGISEQELYTLSILAREGAAIYLARDDFKFYHAKYAVADNETLLVTTENFGESGFPRMGLLGNRGWGIVLEDPTLAQYFTTLFQLDLASSTQYTVLEYGETASPSDIPFKALFKSETYYGRYEVTALHAPENAVEEIIDLIDAANKSIYLEQFYVYKYWGARGSGSVDRTPNLFLEAVIEAARRGVTVRMLLDDTWYNNEKDDPVSNYNTAVYVNEIARKEGLDMEARIFDSERLGVEKLHAKGMIVDGSAVLISSINWNENSPRNNREVGVIVYGEPAAYFSRVFEHDWGVDKKDRRNDRIFVVVILIFGSGLYYLKRHNNEAN